MSLDDSIVVSTTPTTTSTMTTTTATSSSLTSQPSKIHEDVRSIDTILLGGRFQGVSPSHVAFNARSQLSSDDNSDGDDGDDEQTLIDAELASLRVLHEERRYDAVRTMLGVVSDAARRQFKAEMHRERKLTRQDSRDARRRAKRK